MFSIGLLQKRPCQNAASPRPHKRMKPSFDPGLVQNKRSLKQPAPKKHEVITLDPVTFHTASIGATPFSPLQRAVTLFSDASNTAAYCYKTNHPHKSTFHHPNMISASHRYSPYPPHKPSRHSPRSSLSSLNNIESMYEYLDPSIYAIPESFDFLNNSSTTKGWGHVPTVSQSAWGSASPCSEDSAIATPVSEQAQQQPFIHGEDLPLNQDYGLPFYPSQALYSQNLKFLFQVSEGQTVSSNVTFTCPDIAHVGGGYEMLLKAISDSSEQRESIPSSVSTSPSCSFATTFPQYVSPFSDSAVTATPQSHPLFAPRPVRPIPKVCFTPPEEDTLPATSILFKPVSDLVKQAGWPGVSDFHLSGRTNPWTLI